MPGYQNDPVISASDSTEEPAVSGEGSGHAGVHGISHNRSAGVIGTNDFSPADAPDGGNGGWFESTQGEGVRGTTSTRHHGGVVGVNTGGGFGVYGKSDDGQGVVGESDQMAGVFGRGPTGGRFEGGSGPAVDAIGLGGEGVHAVSHNAGSGVVGINDYAPAGPPGAGGNGGSFQSARGEGVRGTATNPHHAGVVGVNTAGGIAVYGTSEDGLGVVGESYKSSGILGRGPVGGRFEGGSGPAVQAISLGGGPAGHFDGNVVVTGDIELAGADLAEEFAVVGELAAEPGCVVVLAGQDQLRVSHEPYDHRVAGVVSGAGTYRPALILDKQPDGSRRPVALTGKVWCKVEADSGPIGLGDLLTTSSTPGHAMRASDPSRAFGAVIGKALGTLDSGRGLLPVLVALH